MTGDVIVSTLRMAKIRLIDGGRQDLPSRATLFQLENALKPLGRNPHSSSGRRASAPRSSAAFATIPAAR
jgi:hypothetical protein